MRLRHAFGAAFGALVLTMTIPTAAHAALGRIDYHYGPPGARTTSLLQDPKSNKCVDIPEIVGHPLQNAFNPNNRTDEDVLLYLEADCQGPSTTLKAGNSAGPLRLFKSVVFLAE
ncbi:hypothetical protein ACIGQE_27550 [Streptomyces sp. NPDC053429]|uniref:hypothetical protein n=1 Tax=Streptomyces sp. NPDC053429 TaxID=3365702 RepID=UPI0037CD5B1F